MNLLIIDGGTTNLRVHLLDAENRRMIDTRKTDGGVRFTAIDGHNRRLVELLHVTIGEILDKHSCPPESISRCVAYGMITSGMGLLEIPHLPAPVSAAELADGMITRSFPDICPFPISFIPGVRNFAGTVSTSNCARMDMMRGEETESIGLFDLVHPSGESMFVLPGSHNKFVHMSADGRILGCMTSISGELLDSITNHTILSGAVEHRFLSEADYDPSMIRAGAIECARSGLGRSAFAGRILNTLGGENAASIQNWLLGAVLAEDVRAMEAFAGSGSIHLYVAGKAPVQNAFIDVLEALTHTSASAVDPESVSLMGIRGALRISGI